MLDVIYYGKEEIVQRPYETLTIIPHIEQWNWLISGEGSPSVAYPKREVGRNYPEEDRKITQEKLRKVHLEENDSILIPGEEFIQYLYDHYFVNNGFYISVAFSAYDKSLSLEEITQFPIPESEVPWLWDEDYQMQSPLSHVEINIWDASYLLIKTKDQEILNTFKKKYPDWDNLINLLNEWKVENAKLKCIYYKLPDIVQRPYETLSVIPHIERWNWLISGEGYPDLSIPQEVWRENPIETQEIYQEKLRQIRIQKNDSILIPGEEFIQYLHDYYFVQNRSYSSIAFSAIEKSYYMWQIEVYPIPESEVPWIWRNQMQTPVSHIEINMCDAGYLMIKTKDQEVLESFMKNYPDWGNLTNLVNSWEEKE